MRFRKMEPGQRKKEQGGKVMGVAGEDPWRTADYGLERVVERLKRRDPPVDYMRDS